MRTITEFEITSYFVLGGFFLCLFLFVFVMWKLNNILRLCLSGLFLFFGFTLMNWAGKLLNNEEISYSLFALVSCFSAAAISSVLVYHLYTRNKKIQTYTKKEKS